MASSPFSRVIGYGLAALGPLAAYALARSRRARRAGRDAIFVETRRAPHARSAASRRVSNRQCGSSPPSAMFHHAAMASHAFMQQAQQRAEFALLEIVEAVVERLCRVGDLLDFGRRLGQTIGDRRSCGRSGEGRSPFSSRSRIARIVVHARLGGGANRGFERSPGLFLVGRQLQRRLHAGELRVEHQRVISGASP